MKKKSYVIFAVLFVLLVTVASFAYKYLSSEYSPESKVQITENTNAPAENEKKGTGK